MLWTYSTIACSSLHILSEQVEAVQMMVNADMFRSKRVVARKFDMHQTPLAARGLELGDLLDSSPQSWIETCQKNKGDWRFSYGRTLTVMAERKKFQPAYKEKLSGVIESLGKSFSNMLMLCYKNRQQEWLV